MKIAFTFCTWITKTHILEEKPMQLKLPRLASSDRVPHSHPVQEETLVIDKRAGLTPSQMVEHKLRGLLRGGTLPVSQLLSSVKGRGPR
jgi:hypothetical protein